MFPDPSAHSLLNGITQEHLHVVLLQFRAICLHEGFYIIPTFCLQTSRGCLVSTSLHLFGMLCQKLDTLFVYWIDTVHIPALRHQRGKSITSQRYQVSRAEYRCRTDHGFPIFAISLSTEKDTNCHSVPMSDQTPDSKE